MEINKPFHKEFKVIVRKIVPNCWRRTEEHNESFNRDILLKSTKKEVKTLPKHTVKGFNSRMDKVKNKSVS